MLACVLSESDDRDKLGEIIKILSQHKCEISYMRSVDELSAFIKKIDKKIILIISETIVDPKEVEKIITDTRPNSYIFYISDRLNPSDYKMMLRSGRAESSDWASAPVDINRYLEMIDNEELNAIVTQEVISKQIVISFIGAGNGAGNTTISMELAIDLVLRAKTQNLGRVAFLDLDTEGGCVCDYLSIDPRLDLNEIAVNPRRLDSYMLEIMSSKHQSGLDVFSVSEPYAHLKYKSQDTAILSLLNCIVDNYSIAIIDIPARCTSETSEIVRNSDLVFCTGIFSVPSAKRIKKILAKLTEQGVPKDKTIIILTDTDTNLLGGISQRFNIESVFKGWSVYYIRRDRSFALECADAGVSMVQTQPRKGICQDIHKVTDYVTNIIDGPKFKA